MATATLNGTELFFESVGDGPVCLVMHGGLGFDHTYFRPEFDRLAARSRLVYYNHRGNGRSADVDVSSITMEQLADDAAGLARSLVDEPVWVIGHSYGGFVAQEFALRHPGSVAGLVLLDTTPGQLGRDEAPRPEPVPPPPEAFLDVVADPPRTDEDLAAAMPGLAAAYFVDPPTGVVERISESTRFRVAAMNRGMEILAAWSSVDRLSSITAPTLIVVGRDDVMTAWPQSCRIGDRVPGADVHIIDGAGHFPWIEQPDRFFAIVEGWLDGRHP